MNGNTDILRGELERLFELDEMKRLSSELLGLDPEEVGGTSGKGAFARALVDRCSKDDALEALADAMMLSKKGVDDRVRKVWAATTAEELKPGTEIGGYRLIKKVGDGALGTVYLGERKNPDGGGMQRAALKVVHAELSRNRAAVRRFLTVQRAFLRSPANGLATILGTGQLPDGRPWVLSEWVDGQTLAARVQRTGPMHFNEARPIIRSVLQALEQLHQRGIVHGDVKTENVFVVRPTAADGQRGEPTGVLTDGGSDRLLARRAHEVNGYQMIALWGTAKAIAPELARGRPLEPRSDLYAVGTTLYEVIAGRAPFAGESPIEVVAAHVTATPDEPSKHAPRGWVPKELDAILLKALNKDLALRFQNAAEFVEALESVGRAARVSEAAPSAALNTADLDAAKSMLLENPHDEELAVAVERVVEPARAWADAVTIFGEAAEKATDTEAKKSLLFRIARINEHEIKDPKAAEAAYRKVLEIDAADEIAQIGIEELKRSSGDAEGLVEILLEKVEKETTREGRAGILREIAGLYEEQLENQDNAFVAWVQAFSEDPSDERSVREIERLADSNERWNEALSALTEAVQAASDPAAQVRLYVQMGRWYADRLVRPDFALPCYGQALTLDPGNEAAFAGTIELYRKAQSWPDLVSVLLRLADASANPARGRDYRAEAAEIVHRKLNDPARAMEIYKEVVAKDPTHPKAVEALEAIYGEKGQWNDLVKLLEARSHNERPEQRIDTLAQVAEIYEDRLHDSDQAAVNYTAALTLDPRNLGALKGIERIYAKAGKMTELLANLRTQLEIAATPRQRISLLERIGGLLEEEFVDHEKAVEAFEQVVAIEPGHDKANAALARIYKAMHRFDDLARTLDRHSKGTEDEKRKIDLLLQAVKVLMVDVGSPDRAIGVCERILAIDPQHGEALDYIARLKASTGDAEAAISATERLAESEKDASKRADLWVRAGKLLEDRGDKDRAIDRYKKALDADKKNATAVAALRSIYSGRGDAHGAAELLQDEIEITQGAISKAKLLAELGQIQRERLAEPTKAKDSFKQAYELDPTNTPAARGLGEMAFEAKNWAEAAKWLEPLLARTGEMPPSAARDVSMMAGDAFRNLGDFQKAQRAYLNAKAFAPDDREVLERVADVTYSSGAADEAAELYKDIADRFKDALVGPERGRILFRFGEAAKRAGELDTAIAPLNEAADLLIEDPAPLAALRDIFAQQGKWELVVRTLRRRMDHCSDEERFKLLVDAGDVLLEKMGDRQKAAKSYVAALEIKGDDRNLLTKLMAVYSESKDWGRLVEVILRIAELVEDPKVLAKYYNTAAAISHKELQRLDEAADYYATALDHNPDTGSAFDGLVEVLNAQQDWERLAEAYRAHLKRVEGKASPEQKAHLWDSLAEILHHRLQRTPDAVECYEEAQKLDPDNRRRTEQLAEIYAAEPKRYFQKAAGTHRAILARSPYRVESYQALRKLFTDLKKPDESWCICQALRSLNMAEPDEEGFFKKHRSRTPAKSQEFFTEEVWRQHILHPDLDPLLTGIFALIQPAVIGTRSQPHVQFGVNAQAAIDAQRDQSTMAQMFHYASGVTQTALPPVFYRESDPGGVSFLYTNPPGIGLGRGALQGGPPQALAFVATRHLSFFRPGHFLRHLVPTGSGLRAWLLAAIKTATPQFPVPGDLSASVTEHIAAFKQHLAGPQQEQLRSLVQKLLAAAPELDLKRWVAAVDLTADRVGFILANDLEIASAVVRASPEETAAVPQKDRLKELYLYCVSEEYLSLRHRMGIAIGGA